MLQHHFATKAGRIKAVDDHVLTLVLTAISQPIPEQIDSVAEIGSRVTRIIAEQTDIADYLGRALLDGSPLGAAIFDALVGFGTARWNQRGARTTTALDGQTLSPATRLRYVDGVSPQNWAKARVNELRLSKPTAVDVSCTDCPGEASSAIARSIRACSR